ncbi:MAG: putative membrane protein YphA (DoxX/SURF4 family) [Candidatus Azotimanducaceae bacterium]|jgi:uncharacterized membrane protein YphA (DoxX/SURF4 family)
MRNTDLSKPQSIISWICQVAAAVILFQTLFFKFTAAPESVYIFEQVGAEPFGRYASGVAELIAGILLLIPALSWAGAFFAMGVMAGAIGTHLTVLGIVVQDDGGTLFALAVVVALASAVVAYLRRAAWLRFIPGR